jgi:hypothetical protein
MVASRFSQQKIQKRYHGLLEVGMQYGQADAALACRNGAARLLK